MIRIHLTDNTAASTPTASGLRPTYLLSPNMASPASPRLPSPPPIPEDQLSPISASPEQQKLFSNLDHNAARRIRPGTKAEDMAEGPPLVDLSEVCLRRLHDRLSNANSVDRSIQPSNSPNTSKRYTTSSHTQSAQMAQ